MSLLRSQTNRNDSSNSGATSSPSVTSASSPVPADQSSNRVVPSPLLQLPKFCQDLLQQSGNGQSNGLSFMSNGSDNNSQMSTNPLAALFGVSSTVGQPTPEQVSR